MIDVIWFGTISAEMITMNTTFLNGNRRNTSPYALSTPSANFTTPRIDVTINEFRMKSQNGTDVVASR